MGDTFEQALKVLLNRFSIDNDANMPDFILAEAMVTMMGAVATANNKLIEHRGDHCSPEMSTLLAQLKDSTHMIEKLLHLFSSYRCEPRIPEGVSLIIEAANRARKITAENHKLLNNYQEYGVQRAAASTAG